MSHPEQPGTRSGSHPYEPAVRFDGGDLDCGSGLLLQIRRRIDPLAVGQLLEIRSTEPSVAEDLPAWCRMTGNDLVSACARCGRAFLELPRLQEPIRSDARPARRDGSGRDNRGPVRIGNGRCDSGRCVRPAAARRSSGHRPALGHGHRQLAAPGLAAASAPRTPGRTPRGRRVPGPGGPRRGRGCPGAARGRG